MAPRKNARAKTAKPQRKTPAVQTAPLGPIPGAYDDQDKARRYDVTQRTLNRNYWAQDPDNTGDANAGPVQPRNHFEALIMNTVDRDRVNQAPRTPADQENEEDQMSEDQDAGGQP